MTKNTGGFLVTLTGLRETTKAYREVFSTAAGRRVLRDLARMCHAAGTTYHEDPREAARREGKRQVWLRIQSLINMDDTELLTLSKEIDNE